MYFVIDGTVVGFAFGCNLAIEYVGYLFRFRH